MRRFVSALKQSTHRLRFFKHFQGNRPGYLVNKRHLHMLYLHLPHAHLGFVAAQVNLLIAEEVRDADMRLRRVPFSLKEWNDTENPHPNLPYLFALYVWLPSLIKLSHSLLSFIRHCPTNDGSIDHPVSPTQAFLSPHITLSSTHLRFPMCYRRSCGDTLFERYIDVVRRLIKIRHRYELLFLR